MKLLNSKMRRDCDCYPNTDSETTDSYQAGRSDTKYIMVFECPTENEKREQRPVVGATGYNLCRLLELVRNCDGYFRNGFDSLRKCEVRIANASTHVHESGDEVETWEIRENVQQLWNYMARCEYVFLFGRTAEKAFDLAAKNNDEGRFKKVISVYHLSPNGIQHIHIKGHGRKGSSEWTLRRLRVIARYLCTKLRARGKRIFKVEDFRNFLKENGYSPKGQLQ